MKTIEILLVDDNEGDILLILEAVKEWKMKNIVTVMKDGEEAMRYLNKEENYSAAVIPDLVILDINLPKVDGKELLQYMKQNPFLMHIPVFIFSSSSHEKDVEYVKNLCAQDYITKPLEFVQFISAVCSIEDSWMQSFQLAPKN